MNRALKACAMALPLVMLTAVSSMADVKTRDKSQVKFEGMLGRMMGMVAGKAAKEGVVTTVAVKGDRKVEMNDTFGRIVDLKEEKVYELDVKKKTYEVVTFEELRRRLREARDKAEKQAPKDEQNQQQDKPAREMDVDFDVKETGQTRSIAGHDTKEVVMTVTVREKGRALEESGGMVMTSNSWLAPAIPALKELSDFELRYWKAIAPEAAGMSAEQMAAVMVMYPMVKQAMERLKTEESKLQCTPLATTTVFEAVKSQAETAQRKEQASGGGLGGMLARKMMKNDERPRATVFTLTHEMLEVTPAVPAEDLQLPAGFKQK